ncbi:hypothetical protein F5Y17DRAFT_144341 [Xylariaceae sp. FL0594]|nr:hypothetical protein F5Y17DRAFT_144341 [Xylariaceae sp. FL0594]
MSGVKNLRAMFEQKGDNLPDRGRSPGPGGFGTPSPSASPRPLSKVRTSFVAVEKDGRIGLKRETSRDSVSVSSRRHSNDTDATTPQPVSERTDIFADNMSKTAASFKSNLSHEAIPESPSRDVPKKGEKHAPLEPNANPDKVMDEEEPKTKMLPGAPTDASATRLGGTVLNEGIGDALGGAPAAAASSARTSNSKAEPVKAIKPAVKTAGSATDAKKPTTSRTPAARPAPVDLPASGTGFVKPKPKSPTRPVKLPASLTTHTAASAQKFSNGGASSTSRQSLSRASGNVQHPSTSSTSHRPPSRNSVSTGAAAAKTLKHRASSAHVSRPRPSLGPPPRQASREPPAPKKESHVDESFLARMMRPTASSSHKAADKAAVTPPRKQAAPVKKHEPTRAEPSGKKVAAKIQASSIKPKTTKESTKPAATKAKLPAKENTPALAKTGTAEESTKEAKPPTGTAQPVLSGAPKPEADLLKDAPTTKEIASAVAQIATAKEAIEQAKMSVDTSRSVLIGQEKPAAAAVPGENHATQVETPKADAEPSEELKAETVAEDTSLDMAGEVVEEERPDAVAKDEEELPVASKKSDEDGKAGAGPVAQEVETELDADDPKVENTAAEANNGDVVAETP